MNQTTSSSSICVWGRPPQKAGGADRKPQCGSRGGLPPCGFADTCFHSFQKSKGMKVSTHSPMSNRLGTKPESFVRVHGHIDTESSLQEAQDPGPPVPSFCSTEHFLVPGGSVSRWPRVKAGRLLWREGQWLLSSCVLRALNIVNKLTLPMRPCQDGGAMKGLSSSGAPEGSASQAHGETYFQLKPRQKSVVSGSKQSQDGAPGNRTALLVMARPL